jgi:hypothetical protein
LKNLEKMIFAETPVIFQTREREKCKNYPNTLYSDITEDEPRVLMSYIDPNDQEKSEWCFECKELEQFLAKIPKCDGASCSDCDGLGCPTPIVKNPWNRQPFDPEFLRGITSFAKTETYIGSLARFESEIAPVRDSVRQLSELDEIVVSRGVREGLSSDPYVTVSSYLNLEPKYWVRLWERASKDDVIATLYHNRLVKIDEIYLVNAIIRHGQMKRQLDPASGTECALSVEERECIASEFQVYDRIINLYFKINFHGLIMSALEEEDYTLLANLRDRGATPEDARSDDQSALMDSDTTTPPRAGQKAFLRRPRTAASTRWWYCTTFTGWGERTRCDTTTAAKRRASPRRPKLHANSATPRCSRSFTGSIKSRPRTFATLTLNA